MSDFLAYHNGPKLDEDYQIKGTVGFRSKRRSIIESARGNKVWVVSRKVEDGKIYLDGAYTAADIDTVDEGDGSFVCGGEVVSEFDPPVLLSVYPWYRELLYATASFVGFQKLKDEFATKFAEIENERAARVSGATPDINLELERRILAEGELTNRKVRGRERSGKVRDLCIEHHKPKCGVCTLDFGVAFGPAFTGLIEVHHLRPFPNDEGEREVDPIADCLPLCPNCHRMAHFGLPPGQVRSIEELRSLIKALYPKTE